MLHLPFPCALKCVVFCLLVCFLFNTQQADAQDTLYFDQSYYPTNSLFLARYYEIRNCDAVDPNRCAVRTFLVDSNKMVSLKRYSDFEQYIYHGKCTYWYKNGTVCQESKYDNGLRQGDQKVYYPNGQLKRKIVWDHDTIVSGMFFNEDGSPKTDLTQEDLSDQEYQEAPQFPGGEEAFFVYLWDNMVYPQKAKEENRSGVVNVNFVVERDGSITQTKVDKPVNPSLDAEALRVIKKMPKWIPGSVGGVPIRVRFHLPIKFALE